jgi:hypothetical protein
MMGTTKESEYRHFADVCLDLAKSSSTVSDKADLLAMAEAWHELAARVSQDGNRSWRRDL